MNRILNVLILGGLLLLFLACGNNKNSDQDKKEEKPVPVEVAKVYRGSIDATYSGSTALEAEGEATVVTKVHGIVEKVFVEEGMSVKSGVLMAQIEPDQYRLRMEQARASMAKMKMEYDRSLSLLESNIISKDNFDRIKYDYENQKAAYELAAYELAQTRIVAPIDGVITRRMIKVGNQVQQGNQLFHIADFSPILAILHVPEKELGKMSRGLKAIVTPDALPDHTTTGFIKLINPVINSQTGTVKVTLEIHDGNGLLKPGMFARVHITTDTHDQALLIPRDALITEDTETFVFFMVEAEGKKRVRKETVKIGYTNTQSVEILSGLKEGDSVVTIGHNTLKDGSQIEVITHEKTN